MKTPNIIFILLLSALVAVSAAMIARELYTQQKEKKEFEELLEIVAEDKTTSNILILGNSGQGKSYLLKLILTNIRESGKSIICDGWCLYGINNQYKDALLLVLKEIFDDQGDWLGWWLYETEDFTVYETVDGEETKCDLRQPEALYDFLIANKESHMQEDGGSHGEERKQ